MTASEKTAERHPYCKNYTLPIKNPARALLYWTVRRLCRGFYGFTGRCKVYGMENVPQTGPLILVANHASMLDPPLVATPLNRDVWFMAKEELFHPPVFRNFMRNIKSFPVRREMADRTAIRMALKVLGNGDGLLIFPEGERTRDGKLQPGQPGASMIALKSRATVVPVAIEGTREMLPVGGKRLKRGQIVVRYGPPIFLSDLYEMKDGREAMAECNRRIMAAIAQTLGVPPPESPEESDPSETGKKPVQ